MSDLIAGDLIANSEAFVSTPSDLIGISNAEDVLSVDILRENTTLGSVLLIKTENAVYEHTKFICDRLDGAIIRDVSTSMYNGMLFQVMEVVHPSGAIEYASSFAAYLLNDQFFIENHWNLEDYTAEGLIYNFQLWANSYEHLNQIMESTIEKMQSLHPVVYRNQSPIPSIFVSNGNIQGNKIHLNLVNKNGARSIHVEGTYTTTETNEERAFAKTIQLSGKYRETIQFELGSVYDIGFRIYNDKDATRDDLFFADGAWGLDYQETALD
ncbi:MAG: hypothetical protein AAGK97_06165, partial [Bacteroidota bacterium]